MVIAITYLVEVRVIQHGNSLLVWDLGRRGEAGEEAEQQEPSATARHIL